MEHHQQSPLTNFDTLNYLCKFLKLGEKFTLGATNKFVGRLVDEHISLDLKAQGLKSLPDKSQRQTIKNYFWRNVRASRISSVFGKEQSTHYNFLRGKHIVKVDAGKNFTVFRDHVGNAYSTKTSMLTSKYNPKLKFETTSNVKKAFGKGSRLFVLHNNGTVGVATAHEQEDQVIANMEILEWTRQVPVVDMVVSYTFVIFVLGCIKVADVKRKIFHEEYDEDPTLEQLRQQSVKLLALNLANARYTAIKYPYEQIKSLCVGCSTAYFVSPKNQLYQCEMLNLNEGQTEISVNLVPYFENKSIIKVWSGFYYYVALARSEYVLEKWDTPRVLEWLKKEGFDDFINIMKSEKVDGKRLLEMDRKYMTDVLGILNSNLQQKMIMSIQQHQEISYQGDELYGWGRNDNGQLGNTMMQFAHKPIRIRMPEFARTEHIEDVVCGWLNTIIVSNVGRLFISGKENKQKLKEQEISDEELKKDIEREKRRRKKSEVNSDQEVKKDEGQKGEKKDKRKKEQKKKEEKKKPSYDDKPHKEPKESKEKPEKPEEESPWFEYKATHAFALDTAKDMLFMTQLAFKEEDHKKKVRTAKAAVDKVLWDPNLDKSEFVVGYFDKYMGTLELPIQDYQKSEIKEHRLLYMKRGPTVVWHREDKIDLL